jgi:formate/nitrite transporter FocA (FNT family)
MMAGLFLRLGAVFFTNIIHNSCLIFRRTQLSAGLVFNLGLIFWSDISCNQTPPTPKAMSLIDDQIESV